MNIERKRVLRALVVDDDNQMLITLLGYLNALGVREVKTARNRQEAESIINKNTVDWVITDDGMPEDGEGLELVKTIRAHQNSAINSLPITFMSGKMDRELVQAAMLAGASDTIAKPFSLTEFKEISDKL